MRNALRALFFGAIAFAVTAIPTYLVSWRLMSLDKLSPEDSPAAVLGAWACCVRTAAISFFISLGTFLFVIISGRRMRHSQLETAD